jgi:magnesium-transporting ATPase (P-type)
MFDNIRKFFYFIFTHNFGELLIVLLSIFLGLPLAMIPVQILAVDLGTDVLPSMALIAERGENVMQSSPRAKKVQLVTTKELFHLFLLGLVIGIGAIINFTTVLKVSSYQAATTIAFSTLVICQFFNILSRCPNTTIFKYPFWTNKWLILASLSTLLLLLLMIYTRFFNTFLSTAPFPSIYWPRVILAGIAFLIFEEIYKWIGRYRHVQK